MSDSEDEASPQLKLEVSDPPLPESPAETSVVSPPSVPPPRLSPASFLFGRTLGEGSYARVVHARYKGGQEGQNWGGPGDRDYAVKVMEKRHIKREDKVKYVMLEKALLSTFSSPLILSLHVSFQDADYLYMCMDMCPGGELLGVIRYHQERRPEPKTSNPCCPTPVTKYYLASVVLALEYLHNLNIIHRDLKPENVLILQDGKMKLGDFGTALDIDGFGSRGRKATPADGTAFVGTAEYVSPEVLEGSEQSTNGVDLWAVGVIAYHMEAGRVMWNAGDTEFQVFQRIAAVAKGEKGIEFPDYFDTELKDMVEGLMKGEHGARLGAGECKPGTGFKYDSIRSHVYFSDFDWSGLEGGTLEPPHKPTEAKWLNVPDEELTDGAMELESYFLDGEATPLTIAEPSRGANTVDSPRASNVEDEQWLKFIQDRKEEEEIVRTGRIAKRKGFFTKNRHLILTSLPRLLYVDPSTMTYKGTIPWSSKYPVSIKLIGDTKFDVLSMVDEEEGRERAYHLYVKDKEERDKWVEAINGMLK